MTTPPLATPHKVDIYAVLSYFAGIGGYAAVLTGLVDPHNHIVRTIVVVVASVSFFSGLALRTFFNQTPAGPVPQNSQGGSPTDNSSSFAVTSNPTWPPSKP